ncbi:MAG TPA: aminotransferase class I/II-fold pyridoxal phosphate-dependent enzyme [Mycobacteriales bacterium]|nr:aminotransferase class I/II-fold pyridoxal phosphate-dependent enzyme [Mycobacteriales bacterium]
MKVLVFAHRLELGGTQVNAIELAATARDRFGQDVVLFAEPGPAAALARQRGLRLIPAPAADGHPSPRVIRALRAAVRAERPDLIHAWDWPQCFDAYYGEHLVFGVPLLCTVMGMTVPSFIPRTLPTTFGTRELVEQARRTRSGPVDLLEPPVDIEHNAPGAVDVGPFRAEYGVDTDRFTLAVVSRLTEWLKLESLLRGIAAVDQLAKDVPVQLIVVGEGTAAARVAERAAEVNDRHGANVVLLTGGLVDPRPAYQVADLMLGMGGSALRSLAFGKPLIVLGERGFSRRFDRYTVDYFRQHGYYGLGDGDLRPDRLAGQIRPLVTDAALRADLGRFGREFVLAEYGLQPATERLVALYQRVVAARPSRLALAAEGGRTAALLAARKVPAPVRDRARSVLRRGSTATKVAGEEKTVTDTPVPLVDLGWQRDQVAAEVAAGLDRVLASTAFIGGPDVAAFEQEFAAFTDRRHCIGMANGTDALELALRAVEVGPGDRVLLPANTFVATAEAVVRAGARPVLVDVDDTFLLMDPIALHAAADGCRAVLPVHLFGQLAPMREVAAIAAEHGLTVIEDAAQCQGASQYGAAMGSLSVAAATSFYPGKNLGAYGDAGAVVTDDDELADRLRLLGAHGSPRKYEHPTFGVNSRLDTIQAVVLRAKLARLAEWNFDRQAAADTYAELLKGVPEVRLPVAAAGNVHVWHLYVVRVPSRDAVLADLQAAGIGAGIHYPTPIHLTGAFAGTGRPGEFPVAERAAGEILSLPIYPGIQREQQERVADALATAVAKHAG